MNNKTRIIIGVVIAVLFVIGIVALEQTQPINSSEPTKITNQNNTQIQNNSTYTVEIESITIVKYALNNDKSSKVNTKPKSVNVNKSSKVNANSKSNDESLIIFNVNRLQPIQKDLPEDKFELNGGNITHHGYNLDSLKSQSLEEDHILLK